MDILCKNNKIMCQAENISFGVFNEPIEKWRLANENDELMYYMIDDGYTLVENVILPEDYTPGKYFYEDGKFILNKDWKPYIPVEKRLENAENNIVTIENAMCETELYSDDRMAAIEDAICELSMLVGN